MKPASVRRDLAENTACTVSGNGEPVYCASGFKILCTPACASADVTECQEYDDTVTYGQLCASTRHVHSYCMSLSLICLSFCMLLLCR